MTDKRELLRLYKRLEAAIDAENNSGRIHGRRTVSLPPEEWNAILMVLQLSLLTDREGFVWVPVSERLPEENGRILAYSEDGVFETRGRHLRILTHEANSECGKPYYTHWMPLPAPPIAAAPKEGE